MQKLCSVNGKGAYRGFAEERMYFRKYSPEQPEEKVELESECTVSSTSI
jgi:hypothetical protein